MFTFPEVASETSSLSSLETALSWFQHCHKEHARCRQPRNSSGDWYPTRLIDIGVADSVEWKLHITNRQDCSTPLSSYLTLSYRWGYPPGFRLLSSTIDRFCEGLPIPDLPRTFQDLITVARFFHIRYIWIDALCIIQDSVEDWETEALMMRLVYANSACNIAASASTNEHGGLFRTRDPAAIQAGIVNLPSLSSRIGCEDVYVVDRDYCHRHIFSSPIYQRGWIFQERQLSPRVLHFGKTQIFWECFEEQRCEGFPNGIPFYWSPRSLDNLWNSTLHDKNISPSSPSRLASSPIMPDAIYFLWNELVKSYSSCAFTQTSDKLPAFAGIAKLFREVTGDEYIAGLWKSRLLDGLAWRVITPRCLSTKQYRAPSWSWASVDGPLKPGVLSATPRYLVQLIDVNVQARRLDTTGAITSANLVVEGLVLVARCVSVESQSQYHLEIDGREIRVTMFFDTLDNEILEGQEIYCLPLKSSVATSWSVVEKEVFFLVLLLVSSQLGVYRRIGSFVLCQEGDVEVLVFEDENNSERITIS
jgi:hypothetical protein